MDSGTVGRLVILLIEDDEGIREPLQELLEEDDYLVRAFRDGAAALDALDAGLVPDVIILDLMMPKLDGWSFRVEQRKRRAIASIPVIVISANESSAARAIDADAYLQKPLSFSALEESVSRVIAESRRKRSTFLDREIERHRALATVVAGIAKEHAGPIEVILSQLDTAEAAARRGESAVPELLRSLGVIRTSVERLDRTVGAISRLSGEVEEWSRIDLVDLLEGTAVLALGFCRGRARLDVSVGEVAAILGSESHLGFAILALVVNAAQACEATGRPDRTVRLSARNVQEGVSIDVADDGVGIHDSIRHRVFEPFFTTRAAGEGTGLGLSIALETIRAHDGTLAFESEVGHGSTFHIVLPAHH